MSYLNRSKGIKSAAAAATRKKQTKVKKKMLPPFPPIIKDDVTFKLIWRLQKSTETITCASC